MPKTKRNKPKWKLVTEFPVTEYECGIRAGERVRLRQDIVVRDHRGKPTGSVYRRGEIWEVLRGSVEPPVVVWLRMLDGRSHTWSDDDDFWRQFERVDEHAV
jgi:hypothetical protein